MKQQMLRFFTGIICILSSTLLNAATPTISDTIDIRHITINLDITDYDDNTINGWAELDVKILVDNITMLPLDLLGLTVDSVIDNAGNHIVFSHTGELLQITLPAVFNTDDSTKIKVYYQGEPEHDGSWGGWYWSGDYAYQMGVGFDAIPHNFGRIWFPCFDNFIERSTFRYEIKTPDNKRAYCGGILESETDNGDGTKSFIWNCNQPIPSYLASVAVSTYTGWTDTYSGIEEEIPIVIAVKPEDSADLSASFIHLHNALNTFETHYGAYSWDRVGYAVVPFSAGAMEHAMNIAYPLFAVNGTTTWETLFAHELSHHWWGDLVTCSTPQEMWLNEGWAVFSEHLFTELLYGAEAYQDAVRANNLDVLHYAAARDGNNYFAISNVPETFTYGATTYNKGASVVHTLRGYMGDELFFSCVTSFLNAHKFQPINAAMLRDYLSDCSGINLNDFFTDWVYQPGSLAFEIEDIGNTKGLTSSICIEQKKSNANTFANNVPIVVSFFNKFTNELVDTVHINMSGNQMMFDGLYVTEYYDYLYAVLDYENKLNDAVTSDELYIKTAGTYNMPNGLMDLEITGMTTPGFVRVEHYWVEADGFKNIHPGLHTSNQRYWRVITNLADDVELEAKFLYNGQATLSGGYLDDKFITNSDDSLVLLFRASPNDDWTIYANYTLNTWGSTTDKRGAMELTKLKSGEYCFGIYDSEIPDKPTEQNLSCPHSDPIKNNSPALIQINPNPADSQIIVTMDQLLIGNSIKMVDMTGKIVFTTTILTQQTSIPTTGLPAGTYQLYVENPRSERIAAEKVVIIH